LPRIRPNTSAARPPLNVKKPIQSGRRAAASRDSSIRSSVAATAAMPIGTLTKKIQRQPRPLVITPPSTGPIATAIPVTAPKTPNATPRSAPRNACAISASEVENMIAPPMPWKARESDSMTGLAATPHSSEPAVKTAMPIANSRRRPKRSASEPAVSSRAASVRA
jgi:hypothetical protein